MSLLTLVWTAKITRIVNAVPCHLSHPSCKLKGQLVNSLSANNLHHISTCWFIWIQIPSCIYKYGINCSKSKLSKFSKKRSEEFLNWWKHLDFRTQLSLVPLCLALTAKSASISLTWTNFFLKFSFKMI